MKTLAIVAVVIFSSGCATMLGRSPDRVLVASTPTGANVYTGGALVGTTPTVIDPPDTEILIEMNGLEYRVRLRQEASPWLWADIPAGFLTGLERQAEPQTTVGGLERRGASRGRQRPRQDGSDGQRWQSGDVPGRLAKTPPMISSQHATRSAISTPRGPPPRGAFWSGPTTRTSAASPAPSPAVSADGSASRRGCS